MGSDPDPAANEGGQQQRQDDAAHDRRPGGAGNFSRFLELAVDLHDRAVHRPAAECGIANA